jgi:drug/metabolite transporter (DMT)-like permease
VSRRSALGIALSILGIGLVALSTVETADSRASLVGDLLVLVGSLAWAIYTVLLKPYTERVSGLQLSALTMTGGALSLLIVAGPAIIHAPWATMPRLGWGALVYSGVFALVIAYYFWYRGVRVIGPTRTAMYSNLQPVVGVLMAWVLLHETPTTWQLVGAVSIMSGLLLTRS